MFCPKCGSLLMPKKERNKIVVTCSCGYKEVREDGIKIREKLNKEDKKIEVIEKEFETLPTCKEICPKCGNDTAYYEIKQMRSADEAPSKFTKCTKCKHTQRDDS